MTNSSNINFGGNEYIVGGWGGYEISKRAARLKKNNEEYSNYYPNIAYVYPHHVINSVLNSNKPNVLQSVINKLAKSLKTREKKYNINSDICLLPSLTSNELHNFVSNDMFDIEEIQNINKKLHEYVEILDLPIELYNTVYEKMPSKKPVNVKNNDKIMKLEHKLLHNINMVEKNLIILATNCNKIRKILNSKYDSDSESYSSSSCESESSFDSDSNTNSDSDSDTDSDTDSDIYIGGSTKNQKIVNITTQGLLLFNDSIDKNRSRSSSSSSSSSNKKQTKSSSSSSSSSSEYDGRFENIEI